MLDNLKGSCRGGKRVLDNSKGSRKRGKRVLEILRGPKTLLGSKSFFPHTLQKRPNILPFFATRKFKIATNTPFFQSIAASYFLPILPPRLFSHPLVHLKRDISQTIDILK